MINKHRVAVRPKEFGLFAIFDYPIHENNHEVKRAYRIRCVEFGIIAARPAKLDTANVSSILDRFWSSNLDLLSRSRTLSLNQYGHYCTNFRHDQLSFVDILSSPTLAGQW